MIDLIKKSLYAGIGAVVLTKEKIQEMTRRLVEDGKITSEESEKLAEEMVKSGERQWEEMSRRYFRCPEKVDGESRCGAEEGTHPLRGTDQSPGTTYFLAGSPGKREGEPKP